MSGCDPVVTFPHEAPPNISETISERDSDQKFPDTDTPEVTVQRITVGDVARETLQGSPSTGARQSDCFCIPQK